MRGSPICWVLGPTGGAVSRSIGRPVAKIIRSELGGGISEVTSTDGVKSTVIKAGRADTCLPTATISRNTPQPTRPVAVEGTGDAINVAASD